MNELNEKPVMTLRGGFTLVEIIVIVVILVIVGMLAIPMMGSAADMQLSSAANMIASDLEYAKNLAISTQQNYRVVFDPSNDSYSVVDSSGSVIEHPVKAGSTLQVSFPSDSRLSQVDIVSADFEPNTQQTITFNYLGSPYSGSGTDALTSGLVTLSAESMTMTITVQPVTGYINIQ